MKEMSKKHLHYIRLNQYGYPEVVKLDLFLWVLPYKITPIEAHHCISSAKLHLKNKKDDRF